MNNKYKSFFLILLTAILGGGVAVVAKVGLREISPLSFTAWRFLFAIIVLLPFFFLQKENFSLASFKKLFWVLLFGAGNILIFIFGIRLTTASSSQVIYTFSPLFAGILSYFILGEKLGSRKIWGILVGFAGTLLVVLLPIISGSSKITSSVTGNLLILLAVFSHALYSVLSKPKHDEFSPLLITTYSAIFTFILTLILLPFEPNLTLHLPSSLAILSILYAGIFGTALFYLLYQYAIKHSSPTTATMVLYLEPIFTFVWAAGLLGEKITIGLVAGTLFVFVGVFLVAVSRDRKKLA